MFKKIILLILIVGGSFYKTFTHSSSSVSLVQNNVSSQNTETQSKQSHEQAEVGENLTKQRLPKSKGIMGKWHEWDILLYGFANGIYDRQGRCRGAHKFFSTNGLFFVAQHPLCKGTFSFRTLLCFEPFTIGACGYPLLFSDGGTADCIHHLIDRFHAHDLISELAIAYIRPTSEKNLFFVYAGLPGSPALGPLPEQRLAAFYIPEGHITHHFLDSTSISYGVITGGYRWDTIQFEVSGFNGRESYGKHIRFLHPRLNSYGIRLSLYPSESLIAEISYGKIHSPEVLAPAITIKRITAAVTYNKKWYKNFWQTTFAWGRNIHCL